MSFKKPIEEKIEEFRFDVNQFDTLFKKYAGVYKLNWLWLKAIAMNESDLGRAPSVMRGLKNPKDIENSKSSDGKSWGLMQVTLTTAKSMDPTATPEKLNNPEYSINLGAKYLDEVSKFYTQFDQRFLEWVVKSYNQGPGNTRREMIGQSKGFANEYWERFKRNFKKLGGEL